VTALNSTGKTDPGFSGAVNLELTPAGSGPGVETVSLKRGSGAALVPVDANGAVELSVEGTSRTVSAAVEAVTLVPGGTLPPGDHRWENGDYVVEADLTIPGEGNLTVSPGRIIYLEPGVNIIVEGGLFLEGAGAEPVVLAPLEPLLPWGGVEVTEGVLTADWTIFQGGGGDPSREFGHSHSQPVVMFRRAAGGFSHCLFLDNPGKALGAWESTLDFTAGLITRCDTGGEFQFSLVRIQSSHILDIPSDDHVFIDDDNDGFYFNGLPDWTQDTSRVENCCFVTGKDDALDHNGARLLVQNCWIEDFMHEGVAASNRNVAVVRNCLFCNCDQGVEAGYGEPLLVVEHCVLLENGNFYGLKYIQSDERVFLSGEDNPAKIVPVYNGAPVELPLKGNENLLKDNKAVASMHNALSEEALKCEDCHTKNGKLDFEALGFSPERVKDLEKNEIVKGLKEYETIHFPKFIW
jgi:hypothetical protein